MVDIEIGAGEQPRGRGETREAVGKKFIVSRMLKEGMFGEALAEREAAAERAVDAFEKSAQRHSRAMTASTKLSSERLIASSKHSGKSDAPSYAKSEALGSTIEEVNEVADESDFGYSDDHSDIDVEVDEEPAPHQHEARPRDVPIEDGQDPLLGDAGKDGFRERMPRMLPTDEEMSMLQELEMRTNHLIERVFLLLPGLLGLAGL